MYEAAFSVKTPCQMSKMTSSDGKERYGFQVLTALKLQFLYQFLSCPWILVSQQEGHVLVLKPTDHSTICYFL